MKTFLKSLIVLTFLLSACIAYILKESGAFKSINPHFNGSIEILESPAGIEDLTIDHETGTIYISSHNRRDSSSAGDLYSFDINDDVPFYKSLTANIYNKQFRPHGISLLKKYGKTYIFAISHEDEGHFVYRFELEKDSLVSSKRFTNELFISPNDLVAIDSASFYFTNDHGIPKGLERTVKDYLYDKNGYVVLYDKGISRKVSQGIAYPNGINVSLDGQFLYVAATTEATLFVYKNDPEAEELILLDKLKTHTGLDNIELDSDGNLYIGAHPQMLKFVSHAKMEENRSPSQVLKIIYLPDTDYKFLQEELYLNDGNPLSGSSVAAYYTHPDGRNDLFVGSVFESKILRLHRDF